MPIWFLTCTLLISGRSGTISTKKVKNNLLAVVLILSVLPPTVQIGKTVVEQCCSILSHKTMDDDDVSALLSPAASRRSLFYGLQQVALTAVHCTRTLVAAATSQTGHPLLRHCCGLLFPGLIEYIAKIAPLISSGSVSDAHIVGVGEIWKAFSAIYASVPEEHRKSMYRISRAHKANSLCFIPYRGPRSRCFPSNNTPYPVERRGSYYHHGQRRVAIIVNPCIKHRPNTELCGTISDRVQTSCCAIGPRNPRVA